MHTMNMDPKFVNLLRRIVVSENPSEVKEAWNRLEELENLESGSENSTYDCNRNYDKVLRSILVETQPESIRNIREIAPLLEWFSKFPFPNNASNPISDDIATFLMASAKRFKKDPCLADILQVIRDNHEKYLQKNNNVKFFKAITEVLAWMHPPDYGITNTKYFEDLSRIDSFLKNLSDIVTPTDNISIIFFKQLCEICLRSDREEDPSSALVIVLRLVKDKLWKDYMNIAVTHVMTVAKEPKIVYMLTLFCKWLVQPNGNYANMKYLSMWLTLFMKGLEDKHMIRICVEVAEVLPYILPNCLQADVFYSISLEENVVFHLLTIIRSLDLYHKVIEQIENVGYFPYSFGTSTLHQGSNKDKTTKAIIQSCVTIVTQLFKEHLKNTCPQCEKFIKLTMFIPEESGEEMEVSYPSTSKGYGRITPAKVGLLNLGNTCYMNSVLQALAMTRQFCREVLLYKTTNDLSDQTVLKNLQDLFALLKYSARRSLAPTEILRASRPSYFMPGQQQDSSEFLCHLLDVLYEQEKSALMQCSSSDQSISTKSKVEDKEMMEVEEAVRVPSSPLNDDGTSSKMARWTTEENLSEGASLQRKTQSLADFTQGEELSQTQNGLSDSHSDSTDSGIQSVGGEDSSSSASSATSPSSTLSSCLVHRVFGGELKVIYQCAQCDNESHNTDRFRDLQLCFLDSLEPTDPITVQNLINTNYFQPEKLTGDNKYRCDRCAGLCDAQRIIKILQAPSHLILTLKHFRYDSESRLRTKLRRKVHYDETVQLPVFEQDNETYRLYAAVVHSGYSMDYGHYITYACDVKNRWYKFNDNFVTETTLDDFKRLEPPDTPYILFYKKCTDVEEEDMPEFSSLSKSIQEYVEMDKRRHKDEMRENSKLVIAGPSSDRFNSNRSWDRDNNDDDEGGGGLPPNNCKSALSIPHQPCLY